MLGHSNPQKTEDVSTEAGAGADDPLQNIKILEDKLELVDLSNESTSKRSFSFQIARSFPSVFISSIDQRWRSSNSDFTCRQFFLPSSVLQVLTKEGKLFPQ